MRMPSDGENCHAGGADVNREGGIDAAKFPAQTPPCRFPWNEIRHNAIKFSGEWKGAKSESAEKQTFWNEFFQVFGIKRRVVASFE